MTILTSLSMLTYLPPTATNLDTRRPVYSGESKEEGHSEQIQDFLWSAPWARKRSLWRYVQCRGSRLGYSSDRLYPPPPKGDVIPRNMVSRNRVNTYYELFAKEKKPLCLKVLKNWNGVWSSVYSTLNQTHWPFVQALSILPSFVLICWLRYFKYSWFKII